jgi:hypothetical protein
VRYFRPLILVSLLALTGLHCWGQQPSPCKVYFKVLESDLRIPGSPIEKLTDAQEKWLRDKEPKKYPAICYDPAKATYVIAWTETQESKTNVRPHVETNTDVNGAVVGSSTTYTAEAATRYVTHISVMKIGADGRPEDPPLFVDRDPAHSNSSSASAAGLEHGIKFLSTLVK